MDIGQFFRYLKEALPREFYMLTVDWYSQQQIRIRFFLPYLNQAKSE